MPFTAEQFDRTDTEGWRPEPGDIISGTVIKCEPWDNPNNSYPPYPVLTLELEDGSIRSVHAFHSVLKDELSRIQPKEGDEIGIQYQGQVTGKSGTTFYKYKVLTNRPAEEVDWNAQAQQAQEELGDELTAATDNDEAPF